MPTVRELARRCGVSRTTVSQALRGQGRMADETRQKIIAEAERIDYRPHSAVQAMRHGLFETVTHLNTLNRRFTYGGITGGLGQALARRGWQMDTAQVLLPGDSDVPVQLPRLFRQRCTDGVVVSWSVDLPDEIAARIDSLKLPVIWVGALRENNCITEDYRAVGRIATEHLLKLGHRRITYGTLPEMAQEPGVALRLEGYLSTMKLAGLSPDMVSVPTVGRQGVQERLSGESRPTAFMAWQDETRWIHHAATQVGLSVPGELSIIAFGANVVTTDGGKVMTTCQIDYYGIGYRAGSAILQRIDHSDPSPRPAEYVQPMIKPGQSDAPPP